LIDSYAGQFGGKDGSEWGHISKEIFILPDRKKKGGEKEIMHGKGLSGLAGLNRQKKGSQHRVRGQS